MSVDSKPSLVDRLNRVEDRMSKRVNNLSEDIDSFFSRDETEVESSASRVRIGYVMQLTEYEDPQYNFVLSSKLVLPKTRDRLHLLLLSDEEDLNERQETGESTPDRAIDKSVKQQKFNVGVRGLFHKSKTSGIALDAGVKIRDPVDPFTQATGRRSFFLEEWEIRGIERLFWYETEGWGSSSTIDFDRPLSKVWLFRFSNFGDVDHESGLWELNHYLAMYQRHSPRTAFGYFVGITSNDEPTLALQTYYVAVNYRYVLIEDWLFLQLTPQLTWPREQDWERINGLQIKIEGVFGG